MFKEIPSSDVRLQFATLKVEPLVIVDQQATVNTFSSLAHIARHVLKAGLLLSWS